MLSIIHRCLSRRRFSQPSKGRAADAGRCQFNFSFQLAIVSHSASNTCPILGTDEASQVSSTMNRSWSHFISSSVANSDCIVPSRRFGGSLYRYVECYFFTYVKHFRAILWIQYLDDHCRRKVIKRNPASIHQHLFGVTPRTTVLLFVLFQFSDAITLARNNLGHILG